MTLYVFNALNEHEKGDATWDGVFIGERRDEKHNILLSVFLDKQYE